MEFTELTKVFLQIESTSKRLDKTAQITEFLSKTEEIEQTLLLLQGLVYPTWSPNKLGIAGKTLIKTIASAYGVSEQEVQTTFNEIGDLGLVAELISKNKKQTTLSAFSTRDSLSISKVFTNLQKIAIETGASSTQRKTALITELLSCAEPLEAKYIIRLAAGDLRIGISTGTIRDAIQQVFLPEIVNLTDETKKAKEVTYEEAICVSKNEPIRLDSYEEARKVHVFYSNALQIGLDKINDMAPLAKIAKEKSIEGLKEITLEPLVPCRVMLMQKVTSVKEGTSTISLPMALEYKYDGFRGIAHKKENTIKIFTRSLEDVSTQFPELIESLQKDITAKEAIIDGEILGLKANGSYVPFQEVSQRIKRKHNIAEMVKKLPVAYVTWDILYKDGEELINKPMQERRDILKQTIKEDDRFHLSEQLIINTIEDGDAFYEKSLSQGNEGVVLKDLNGTYQPGNRVGCWLKLKPIMDPLDVVVVAAEWGEGKRATWLTSFTVAIKHDDEFLPIGKVGTGFKELDQESGITFSQMTDLLKPLITKTDKETVYVQPQIIISVKYEEIQKSSAYASGFALRFPRVLDLREDLDLQEIDDLAKVKQYYNSQS